MPRTGLAVLLTVDALAALVLAGLWFGTTPRREELVATAVLLVLVVAGVEGSGRVERARERYSADSPYRDVHSTWTFAGALLLPPALAVSVTLVVYLLVWVRVKRYPPYRFVYSTATALVGTAAASLTYQYVAGGPASLVTDPVLHPVGVAVAAAVALVVNVGLLAVAMVRCVPAMTLRVAVGPLRDLALECATLCLGVLVVTAYLANPWFTVFALPVLSLLGHTMLIAGFRRAATRDPKTGLTNATAWHEYAERELARAERVGESVTLLMVDLDRFKDVNDTHGHLSGDAVLRAVASVLTDAVREYDVVGDATGIGRFGGEEFVILLPGADAVQARAVAERLRARIADLRVPAHRPRDADGERLIAVTVSIGVSTYPVPATDLTELLHLADMAVYAAKAGGRNRIEHSPAG